MIQNAFDYRFGTKPLGGQAQVGVDARRPRDQQLPLRCRRHPSVRAKRS